MKKAPLRVGVIQAMVLCLGLMAASFSYAGQPVRPSFAKACQTLEQLSSQPQATRDQWTKLVHSFLEIHRTEKDRRAARQSLFLAGRASLSLYRRGGKAEDLDRAIQYLYEFSRIVPDKRHRIAGLKELKEAHLLKRRLGNIHGNRPAPASATKRITRNNPPLPPLGNHQNSAGAGRIETRPSKWTTAAKGSPEVSEYKYTGNPFCPADGAWPTAKTQPGDIVPDDRVFRPEGPHRQPVAKESIPCPPKPSLPPAPSDSPAYAKTASLQPRPAGDLMPPPRPIENAAKDFLVVIDPGHGGKDPGAVSKDGGIKEKNVTLEVAYLVKKRLLSDVRGIKVEMTRTDDRFLTLQERTALANSLNADLFISLHCNADSHSSSRGVETFYLSKASSPRAMRLAARENGIPLAEMSDLQATLLDLMLASKKSESDRLANTVHHALVQDLAKAAPKIRNRGVKRAPFYVLLGAKMPAILVECAFISNGRDEQKLTSAQYLDAVATGIAAGAGKYLRELGSKS
ncbi:MAG: N-acetylmuramoyl-L-alanine amidase [Desulfomonile tiedjei]|nr:N-acetylmuramoyl-L-alanine amidase [Desulfomonile tiedjei]